MESDPLNVLLAWTDREVRRAEGDQYVAESPLEEGQIAAVAPPDEPVVDPTAADFEWSEDRARAIDSALVRLGQAPSARVCALLTELVEHRDAARLDAVEAWLHAQLPRWSAPVRESPEVPEAGSYNEALTSATGGLHLALEVVAMLRSGEPHQLALAEPLLRQVNDFFQQARHHLLAAEPPPVE